MYFTEFAFVSTSFLLVPLVGTGVIIGAWFAAQRSESVHRRLRLIVLLVILAVLAAALVEVLFTDRASVR